LRESLESPQRHITPGYAAVHTTTKRGSAIVGVVASESTFSIQLRDASGRVFSLWKEELAALERPETRSLMAAYQGDGIDDMVAYLAGLGGAK
jgi:hypothetical protein